MTIVITIPSSPLLPTYAAAVGGMINNVSSSKIVRFAAGTGGLTASRPRTPNPLRGTKLISGKLATPGPDWCIYLRLDLNDKINDLRASEVRFFICNKIKVINGDFTLIFKVGLGWGMIVTDDTCEKLLAYKGLTFQALELWVKYKVTNIPYRIWTVNGPKVVTDLLKKEVITVTKL